MKPNKAKDLIELNGQGPVSHILHNKYCLSKQKRIFMVTIRMDQEWSQDWRSVTRTLKVVACTSFPQLNMRFANSLACSDE